MKVLVTGATGFVGNYVIQELLKQKNIEIIATATDENKAKTCSWFNAVNFVPYLIKDEKNNNNLFDLFYKPDLVIHLAWQGLPNYKDAFHLTQNLPSHKLFLKNLIDHGLNNITVIGTCFEYGMKEGMLLENMQVEPDNAYGKAKNELQIYLSSLNTNLKWVRLFYLYGDGQSEKSLFTQLNNAIKSGETIFNMSGGQQIRDFLHIEACAKNILKIAFQNKILGIINCCSGKPITVENFVKQILKANNWKIELNLGHYPYSDYEPMEFWGDITKLKKVIYNDKLI